MFKMRDASLCLLCLCAAMPGLATTVQSVSETTWASEVTGTPTTVDLSSLTGNYSTIAGISEGGYTFTGPDGANQWFLNSSEGYLSGGLFGAYDGVGGIEITLPDSGQSAIFLSAEAYNPASGYFNYSQPLTLTIAGDSNTYTFSGGNGAITSDSPITSLTIYAPNGDGVFLSSANFGTASQANDDPAPSAEGATIALVGGGMLVVFGAKRKLARRLAV